MVLTRGNYPLFIIHYQLMNSSLFLDFNYKDKNVSIQQSAISYIAFKEGKSNWEISKNEHENVVEVK